MSESHCVACGRPKSWRLTKRGMCPGCYSRNRRAGTLDAFPCGYVGRDVMLSEYEHLRESRVPFREMPGRIGVSRAALERALQRARAAGDDRAATFRGMRDGAQR